VQDLDPVSLVRAEEGPFVLTVRAGEGEPLAWLRFHSLQRQVKVKELAARFTLKPIHRIFPTNAFALA
jgi:hypothetical protein